MSKQKIIALTGGGSGGHITPLLSVAEVLRKTAPEYKLVYIGQKGDPMAEHMKDNPLFSAVYSVRAGKFRRYHGEGLKQLLDVVTMLKNARDFFFVCIGFVQSLFLLGRIHPSVLFCKGGYVGVPLGLAAALRRVPYVTHDSDAVPGLANRIIARWASIHAVALPKERYAYPAHKTITVGVPVQSSFRKVTDDMQAAARVKLGLAKTSPVLLVIGGGLGAEAINNGVLAMAPYLLAKEERLTILHVAGQRSEDKVSFAYDNSLDEKLRKRVRVYGFTKDVALLGEAATVVITRAGATNMAEFSLQAKPCIIIPHPHLTGGHQLKNAQAYADAGAALVLAEEHIDKLIEVTELLLNSREKQLELSEKIHVFSNKQSAESLAGTILTTAHKGK